MQDTECTKCRFCCISRQAKVSTVRCTSADMFIHLSSIWQSATCVHYRYSCTAFIASRLRLFESKQSFNSELKCAFANFLQSINYIFGDFRTQSQLNCSLFVFCWYGASSDLVGGAIDAPKPYGLVDCGGFDSRGLHIKIFGLAKSLSISSPHYLSFSTPPSLLRNSLP